jgi:hypothetical protein
MEQGNLGERRDHGSPWLLRGVVIGLALVVGLIAWIATSGDEDESTPAAEPASAEARIVSEEELAEIASTAGYPVFWAGPIDDTELEVTESGEAGVLVRYLEDGAGVGEGSADFLAVGSYPLDDPTKALENFANRPGSQVQDSPELGDVVFNEQAPSSVYFGDPGNEVQVEVYAASPEEALDLTLSGQIEPVG